MASVICSDECLWIRNIGCGFTRRVLLGLEPGSRIWIAIENEPVLFERMQDGADGRSTRGFKPVGPTRSVWRQSYLEQKGRMIALNIVKRPIDAGKAAEKL